MRVAADEAVRVEVSPARSAFYGFECSAECAYAIRQADKAEAALRADEHRRQLAAAAASLWQQSDRVKALAGAALLGEVLAERQVQIAGATQAAEAARRADAAFLVAQRQRMEVRLCLRRLSIRAQRPLHARLRAVLARPGCAQRQHLEVRMRPSHHTARPIRHWVSGCMRCTHASARSFLTAGAAARGQEEAAAEQSRLQAATARAAALRNQQLAQLETLQQQILADRQEVWREGQQLRQQAATDAALLEVRSAAGVALHALG